MAPQKLLIFGSTGPLGLLFITKALSPTYSHTLTLFVRSPSKLPDDVRTHPNVTIIETQLKDTAAIESAVQGQDAIVSFLGPNSFSVDPDLYADTYRTIFTAMRTHGVTRIFALATISVHAAEDKFALPALLSITSVRVVANSAYTSMLHIGSAFENDATDLHWTLFRVGGLADGPESDADKVVATMVGGDGYSATARRADVASWVLRECEKGEGESEWVAKMPVVCTVGSGLVNWRPGFARILGLA